MLKVNNITFSRGKKKILENLSFQAKKGECTVIAGPNGSGKSTALALIAGVIKPDSGSIEKDGNIGYIPQESALFEDMTVLDNLRFFAKLAKASPAVTHPFSVDSYLKKRVSKLSGGMKKQVSIACALIGEPQIMLLDEPCAALDAEFKDELIHIVKKWKNEGKAVVYVSHAPTEFTEFFDELIFLGPAPRHYTRSQLTDELKTIENFTEFYKHVIKTI